MYKVNKLTAPQIAKLSKNKDVNDAYTDLLKVINGEAECAEGSEAIAELDELIYAFATTTQTVTSTDSEPTKILKSESNAMSFEEFKNRYTKQVLQTTNKQKVSDWSLIFGGIEYQSYISLDYVLEQAYDDWDKKVINITQILAKLKAKLKK